MKEFSHLGDGFWRAGPPSGRRAYLCGTSPPPGEGNCVQSQPPQVLRHATATGDYLDTLMVRLLASSALGRVILKTPSA